jgi:signal recognition particle GTPase
MVPNNNTNCSMILVMGVTGSGKSYFINKLAKNAVVEGHSVRSG